MNIQVLLYDDEEKIDFVGLAELEGIDVTQFQSAQESIDELKRTPKFYHAVILDAKGILNKDDQKTGLDGLRELRDFLKELNAKIYLPHFIFTGQPDYQSETWFRQSYGEFFIKGKDEQLLLDKIKNAVSHKEEFVVHKKHSDFFQKVKILFDSEIYQYITDLLVSINKIGADFDDKRYFTQLRIVLEHIFRFANKSGLLHDKCLEKGKVNLTESSLFLAGELTKYLNVRCSISHFPKLIADAVKEILFITGAASHTTDPELEKHFDLTNYRKAINSPYLLYSLTFRLMDIIIWFDEYVKINNDYSKNVALWQELNNNSYEGLIEQDEHGDFHCGEFMLNNNYVNTNRFPIGTRIQIIEFSNNTSKTKLKYPQFGSKFKKLD